MGMAMTAVEDAPVTADIWKLLKTILKTIRKLIQLLIHLPDHKVRGPSSKGRWLVN